MERGKSGLGLHGGGRGGVGGRGVLRMSVSSPWKKLKIRSNGRQGSVGSRALTAAALLPARVSVGRADCRAGRRHGANL